MIAGQFKIAAEVLARQSFGGVMRFALVVKQKDVVTMISRTLRWAAFRPTVSPMTTWALILTVTLVSFVTATAQQTPEASSNSRTVASVTSVDDERYRIGPGDVLEVRVLKAPELSREAVRVDQRGMIRMPMIEDDIVAACLTEVELAHKIASLYLEYKRNPNVDVFIKEFQSQTVGVVGAVNNVRPEGMQFKLQRRVRLLELLTLAGGLSEKAGRSVNVVHTSPVLCGDSGNSTVNVSDVGTMLTYKLNDTMHGVPEANPVMRPGDIVVVPEGEQAYVVGNVMRPVTVPLKEIITVSKAIAMAGGTAPSTKRNRVRIIRQMAGESGKQEIYVDLTAIEKRNAIDVILLPNDIVDVPTDSKKAFLKSLTGAVAPTVSNGVVRVIP